MFRAEVAMGARYKASYAGIGEMLCAPGMVADMRRRAEAVQAVAENSAPVARTGAHRGRYKAAFRVSSGIREGRTRRAYGRVSNDAPEALIVEYGNRNTPRHRTLGRALDAAKE
jgi:hypothetical protein